MRVKIISDGTVYGTRIVDTETGKQLDGVTEISWHLSVGCPVATAQITLVNIPVEIEGELSKIHGLRTFQAAIEAGARKV